MRAPIIGLSAYSEPAQWAVWQAPAALLPMSYIDQVTEAGGVPVLLPPVPGVASALGRLDGLILTGGGDVDPAGYGAQADPRTSRVQPGRDQAELELLAAALAEGLPVLGVCRGMQVLNVARGGTLCQHLPDEAGHRPAPGTFGSHRVRLAPGSRLGSVLRPGGSQPGGGQPGGGQPGGGQPGGDDELTLDVATAHHQGIDRLGDGLVPVAWAQDGLIEAVELAGPHPFALGVQWHPEAGPDGRLVSALVAAAANGRAHGSPLIVTA
jgi:putative glutamine amidotransferase